MSLLFFFFNDTATTEIYTLSLHDALPILVVTCGLDEVGQDAGRRAGLAGRAGQRLAAQPFQDRALKLAEVQRLDRKSTRLNSSHANISYAVFCLKKKKRELLGSYFRTR